MTFSISLILLFLALVCFVLDAIKFASQRISLTPLGLAFWVMSLILTVGVR